MTAIIVDDESAGRETLRLMLTEFCPEVAILAEANSLSTATRQVFEHKPDVLFLDIELGNGDVGFDLLDMIEGPLPHVIFTTAFDHYAIKAIKYAAIDYLLKPIDIQELTSAIERVRARDQLSKGDNWYQMQQMFSQLKRSLGNRKLYVNTINSIFSIDTGKIVYLKSDGNYTHIFIDGGEKITASKTLKEFEQLLDIESFLRVHQSFIVNINYVKRFMKTDGGTLVMTNGSEIEVSVRKKADVLRLLQNR